MNIRHIVLLILDWVYKVEKVSKEYSTFCSSREMSNLSNEYWTLHYQTFLYNLAPKLKIIALSSCFSKKDMDILHMSYIPCPKYCLQTLVQPKMMVICYWPTWGEQTEPEEQSGRPSPSRAYNLQLEIIIISYIHGQATMTTNVIIVTLLLMSKSTNI